MCLYVHSLAQQDDDIQTAKIKVVAFHSSNEVVAILAHEIGHLVHRHSVRMALQNSAVAVLIATVTGDPFSTSSLVVALPTLMVNAQYSQVFENEADDYAYTYLKHNNIPLHSFADILLRITGDEETSTTDKGSRDKGSRR